MGSDQAVPALAALLNNADLSADAQFALRSIPGAQVDQALRQALAQTKGLQKAGVIQTLGARQDRQALPLLAPLAGDHDLQIAEAAFYALGNIGGEEALRAVQKAQVPESLSGYRDHALLLCAESLPADKKAEAGAVYRALLQTKNKALRAAAMRGLVSPGQSQMAVPYRVLLYSKTLGFRHSNIPLGIKAIRQLGAENGFTVDATEDSSVFTQSNLARYKAVVFLSVTGNVLNAEQEKAFKDYILGGGGFAAIHGALYGPSACEENWAWYGELFCTSFKNHSAIVPAKVDVEDRKNPSTKDLPEHWQRTDEWYNYNGNPRGKVRVLATVDETTYQGGTLGADHPISWCRRMGKGRVWYTAMGHTEASFTEPLFLKHILGGIQQAADVIPADFTVEEKSAK